MFHKLTSLRNHSQRLPSPWLVAWIVLWPHIGFQATGMAQEAPEHSFASTLAKAPIKRTIHHVAYDGFYRRIPYPMGDVPDGFGVCTDLMIRAYHALGIDLQEVRHKDMQASFSSYPTHWGLTKPDSNIAHRRVPNLQTFLWRHEKVLPVTLEESDYSPGELVTWIEATHRPHIGIVTNHKVPGTQRPMIVYNIGEGPKLEDILFKSSIADHYRYGQHLTSRFSTSKD